MPIEKTIRNFPLFELYVANNHLIVTNSNNVKDNCNLNLKDILSIELLRNLSFLDKVIEVYFGFWRPSKSDVLRINLKNGFKDILLPDCDNNKTALLIYEINHLIINQVNNTNPA